MNVKSVFITFCVVLAVSATGCAPANFWGSGKYQWQVHDMNRPVPKIVTPDKPGMPPSDAIILFDGKDISNWVSGKGGPARWEVENGYMKATKGGGNLVTKQAFGDCQLHVEWATPTKITGKSQGRGNSGVYLMKNYEVQILDSYNNPTYPDGQAASIYGQNPPMVNACLAPGEWQTYDIIFRRPVFKNGKVVKPAVLTVFHNGVLVQDHFELTGRTWHKVRLPYKPHEDKMPILLQYHGNPVLYRNIWIRELQEK